MSSGLELELGAGAVFRLRSVFIRGFRIELPFDILVLQILYGICFRMTFEIASDPDWDFEYVCEASPPSS